MSSTREEPCQDWGQISGQVLLVPEKRDLDDYLGHQKEVCEPEDGILEQCGVVQNATRQSENIALPQIKMLDRPVAENSTNDKKQFDAKCEVAEMKELLLGVLDTQKVILEEIRHMREDSKRNFLLVNESLESQRCFCKDYTDAQVRTMECRMNGLAAVLDHVQKRCMEAQIQQHETGNEYESISSSDSSHEQDDYLDMSRQEGEDMIDQIQEDKNRRWLRQHHMNLIGTINPKGDLLVDRLAQDDILSVSDEEKILSHTTRKNQARELVIKLRRCSSSQFHTFLMRLQTEYPHLPGLASVDDDTGEADNVRRCIVCDVTKLVDVDDVIDYVYQQGFLDGAAFETVWKTEVSEERWCRLFEKLAIKSDGIEVLVEALGKKYPVISQRVATARLISLECSCSPRKDN